MPSERARQIESFENFVSRGSDPQKGTGTLPSAVPIREVVIKKHVPTAEEKDIFKRFISTDVDSSIPWSLYAHIETEDINDWKPEGFIAADFIMKAMPLSLPERRELAKSDRRFQPFLSELQSSVLVGDSPDVTGDSFEDLKVEPLVKCTTRKNIMSTMVNVKNSSFLVFLTHARDGKPVLLMNKHVFDRCLLS